MSTMYTPVSPEMTVRFVRRRLFFLVSGIAFLAAVVVAITALGRMARATSDRDFILQGQAAQLARTGLTEATNWLRRQPEQPVVRFEPAESESAEPRIGLVREFLITDSIWGRFEVWRGAGGLLTDPMHRQFGLRDVSQERGYRTPGAVWRLCSIGYVFERPTPDTPFDPTHVLHREVLAVDVARLGIRLPGQAALCARDAGDLQIRGNARVSGGAAAVGIFVATGAVFDARGVTGAAAMVAAGSEQAYDDSVEAVFGVDRATLVAMADEHVTQPSYFPTRLRTGSLCFVDTGDLDCTAARPLRGHGILFVAGNLTLSPGSTSQFTGLIYVDGDLSIQSEAELTGAVVVTGSVAIGSARGTAAIRYDDEVLQSLVGTVGAYRTASAVTRVEARAGTGQ